MTWERIMFWAAVGTVLGICAFSLAVHADDDVDYHGEIYRPSPDIAKWFASLDRPDWKAGDSIISCCDAGDAYPIVILQEASIGGEEPDGIAEVTDTSARLVITPNGERKWRLQWAGPTRFHFPGKLVTREIKGNPTPTAWVFATVSAGYPKLWCLVPLPPAV
jgi:hypothetical protein